MSLHHTLYKNVSFGKGCIIGEKKSFRYNNTAMEGTTFKVHDVEQSTQLYETEKGTDIQSYYSQKILASSIDDKAFIQGTKYTTGLNQFLCMLLTAYSDHKPIVITPDVLWLLICQGFAAHVKKNMSHPLSRDKVKNNKEANSESQSINRQESIFLPISSSRGPSFNKVPRESNLPMHKG